MRCEDDTWQIRDNRRDNGNPIAMRPTPDFGTKEKKRRRSPLPEEKFPLRNYWEKIETRGGKTKFAYCTYCIKYNKASFESIYELYEHSWKRNHTYTNVKEIPDTTGVSQYVCGLCPKDNTLHIKCPVIMLRKNENKIRGAQPIGKFTNSK
eukprot:gene6713-16523_t